MRPEEEFVIAKMKNIVKTHWKPFLSMQYQKTILLVFKKSEMSVHVSQSGIYEA